VTKAAPFDKWLSLSRRAIGAILDDELQGPVRASVAQFSGRGRAMNPTAKPVKKSKKVEPAKKLERKTNLMSVRSLTVNW
jgi:hypothetical protein